MTIDAIAVANRRRRAFISQWAHDPVWAMIQVGSPDMLKGKVQDITGQSEARTGRVGGHRERSVVMLEGGADRDESWSVWVRATFSNYKAAYLSFLNQAYGIAATSNEIPGYQVDHLSNRAYAPSGNEFIRIEAIPQLANHSWGVNFESRRTENTDARESHLMSYMSCAKLAGLMPPLGPNDTAGIDALVAFFTSLGLDPQEASRGVSNMLQHAYWRR